MFSGESEVLPEEYGRHVAHVSDAPSIAYLFPALAKQHFRPRFLWTLTHSTAMNFRQTGAGTLSIWPVGVSFPVAESIRKITIVPLS
jgi:hypothetical protein